MEVIWNENLSKNVNTMLAVFPAVADLRKFPDDQITNTYLCVLQQMARLVAVSVEDV
jgi:hypothetical protein